MNRSEYIKYIKCTIQSYNSDKIKNIFSLLKKEGIINTKEKEQTSFFKQEGIYVEESNLKKAILEAVSTNDKAIELYEKEQFFDCYKYSAIFSFNNLEQIIRTIENIPDCKFSNDIVIYDTLKNPKKILIDDKIAIKFNKKYTAVHPQTREEMFLDYPILIIIHKKEKIVEIRLNSISDFFIEKRTQLVYAEIIKELIEYMEKNWKIEVQPLEIGFIRGEIKENQNIKIIEQSMNMSEGSKAQLSVGNSKNYVLPFIGEMKEMIEHESVFKKNPEVKEILENFIKRKEELTDYPWIKIEIIGNTKSQNINEKLNFNYMNQGYCLIQHYHNPTVEGMERMNDVIKHINKYIGEKKGE